MRVISILFIAACSLIISACGSMDSGQYDDQFENSHVSNYSAADYSSRMPSHINTTEKVVIVNPNVHAWGAYDRNGNLVKAGIATAGGTWCEDIGRSCHTATGTFRIYSLGDSECISRIYPLPHGGGLMPYCMYFHGGQALHGSPDNAVVDDNISHGCVRMRIPDAEWLRYNFAKQGTKVIVEAY